MSTLQVHAIPRSRLAAMLESGRDDLDNQIEPWSVGGGEPLRCCLRLAEPGDDVALVAYRPFPAPSHWSEIGPVFVHRTGCPGYDDPGRLPDQLRTGPRILRTYREDGSMDYDHITYVPKGVDLEQPLLDLLAQPEVARVHVRAATAQCFTYEVLAG